MSVIDWQTILRENNELFVALINSGVLEMCNGSITLHYDSDGRLRKIEKLQTTFKS